MPKLVSCATVKLCLHVRAHSTHVTLEDVWSAKLRWSLQDALAGLNDEHHLLRQAYRTDVADAQQASQRRAAELASQAEEHQQALLDLQVCASPPSACCLM